MGMKVVYDEKKRKDSRNHNAQYAILDIDAVLYHWKTWLVPRATLRIEHLLG